MGVRRAASTEIIVIMSKLDIKSSDTQIFKEINFLKSSFDECFFLTVVHITYILVPDIKKDVQFSM